MEKAGSYAHIEAVLQVARRAKIDGLQRAINSLTDSWERGRFWRGKRLRKNTGGIVKLIALVRGSLPRTKYQPQLSSFSLKLSRLKLVAF